MSAPLRREAHASSPEALAADVEAGTRADEAVARYALGLGDDALVLAQRLGEWIANAPELEEDMALGNIGLDLLGHARSLLTYAGSAWGRTEDDLAYFRDEPEFRCRQIFELPIGDFGFTIARQLVVSAYFRGLYRQLTGSADPVLAAIASKAVKEVAYHLEHAEGWIRRLGLGTDESHRRMQAGLDAVWPHVEELFSPDPAAVPGVSADLDAVRAEWDGIVPAAIRGAGLRVPEAPAARGGGREGVHDESFGHLLAEMQVLARSHPGATW